MQNSYHLFLPYHGHLRKISTVKKRNLDKQIKNVISEVRDNLKKKREFDIQKK
jgi:hypothetical protein